MGNFMPINLITSMKWMIYTNTINSGKKQTDNLKNKKLIFIKKLNLQFKTFPQIKLQIQKAGEIYYW